MSAAQDAAANAAANAAELAELTRLAGAVPDPELPVVSLADLGVLRAVRWAGPGRVVVELAPTWLGCPAVPAMAEGVRRALAGRPGVAGVTVVTVADPPWSSDDITPAGRRRLAAAGIAPPRPARGTTVFVPAPALARRAEPPVPCPHCGAADTALVSSFGATPCRALRRCRACGEPFDHVKER